MEAEGVFQVVKMPLIHTLAVTAGDLTLCVRPKLLSSAFSRSILKILILKQFEIRLFATFILQTIVTKT